MKDTMKQTDIIEDQKSDKQVHHEHIEKMHKSSSKMGFITILLIFGLFGLWSIFAEIDTTINANGKIITSSYNKTVMHTQGGVVKKIYIEEGSYVKKDQPLLKLDSIAYQSQLASNITKHDRNLFSICKLKSEVSLKNHLDCISYEKDVINVEKLKKLSKDTEILFLSDMRNLQSRIKLLNRQSQILRSKNNGLEKQIASNKKLLLSFEKELQKWNKLLKADAIDELKVIETQRQIEQSHLQIGSLQSEIEENLANIKANESKIELERESFKNSALVKSNELELDNQLIHDVIISLKNTIQSTTITAPSDGLIIDMKIHATGEVVSPLKSIMSIVPGEKDLMIEAYVLPTDVEKIYKGQKTEISFPAFIDPSAIPIEGELTYISADTIIPDGMKESFYRVLIKITSKGFEAIEQNTFKLLPGMPSTVFIQTGKSTLMQYLLQPIVQMFKGIYHAN